MGTERAFVKQALPPARVQGVWTTGRGLQGSLKLKIVAEGNPCLSKIGVFNPWSGARCGLQQASNWLKTKLWSPDPIDKTVAIMVGCVNGVHLNGGLFLCCVWVLVEFWKFQSIYSLIYVPSLCILCS